ncbi:MAG: PilN domain-containing protein [Nitrospira sp.]
MLTALRAGINRLAGRLGQTVGQQGYFQIPLATRFRWYLHPLRAVLVACCVGLCVAIAWSIAQTVFGYQEVWRMSAELEHVRQQDQQLLAEATQEGVDLSDLAMQQLPAEVALANQLLEKRTFSWTAFLAGLEQALPPRLALSSVRLESGGSLVHLTGSAMTLEDLTAFTVGLQDHPKFKDPVLAQHRVGPSGLVEFDVTVRYRREGA